MKKFKKELEYRGTKVIAVLNRNNILNNNDLILFSKSDYFDGYEPYANCNANIEYEVKEDDIVIVKDYSENKGMLEWLYKNNIIIKGEGILDNGYVVLYMSRVNMKMLEPFEWDDLR